MLKWEGLVDAYYLYNFNSTSDNSLNGPAYRAFDTRANSFTVNYAKFAAQADWKDAGFRVDLGWGLTGGLIANGTTVPAFAVQQAYGTAKFSDLVTLDAGKFNTQAGSEVTESNRNWLYSRSLLFYGIPAVHTGLRLNLKVTPMITITPSLVNGWNNDVSTSNWKTFGLSVAAAPTGDLFFALNTYFGKDGPPGMPGEAKILADLVANVNLSPTLALNLNFDYYKLDEAVWLGAALMAKIAVSDAVYVAARGEFVKSDKGGYCGSACPDATNLFEGTAMVGLPMGSHYEIRIEGRGDFSDKELFQKSAGMAAVAADPSMGIAASPKVDPVVKKNQFTALVAFLAFFQ